MARLSPGVLETVQVLRSLAYRSKTPDYRSQLKINSPSICQNRSLGKTSCSTVHVAQHWTWFVKRLTFWPTFEQILGSFRVSISQFLFSNFCCFLWHSTSCLPTTVWMGGFFQLHFSRSRSQDVRVNAWFCSSPTEVDHVLGVHWDEVCTHKSTLLSPLFVLWNLRGAPGMLNRSGRANGKGYLILVCFF